MAEGPSYKGVPLSHLRIDSVVWDDGAAEHIRTRSDRRPGEFDVEPEWATEAALDPERLVRLARPHAPATQALKVIGWSVSARRLLKVWIWTDDPSGHEWTGASAAAANDSDRHKYEGEK